MGTLLFQNMRDVWGKRWTKILQVTLVAFRQALNSHALQEISKRRPHRTLSLYQSLSAFLKISVLLSEKAISQTEKDKFGKTAIEK